MIAIESSTSIQQLQEELELLIELKKQDKKPCIVWASDAESSWQ